MEVQPTDNTSTTSSTGFFDLASGVQAVAVIGTVAGDVALPTVLLPVSILPSGKTITRIIVLFKYRKASDTSAGVNKLSGNQNLQIQKDPAGAFATAIVLSDDMIHVLASSETGGDVVVGLIDVKATVNAWNQAYNLKITNAKSDGDNLNLYDIQTILRVYYG